MDIDWFTLTEKKAYEKLWPKLKGKVFHRTSLENYRKILACGFIDNNKNEKYKLNWSSNSYFRNRGCISVCDLYNHTRPVLTKKAVYQYRIFSQREDIDDKFVFLFLHESAYHHLIKWEKEKIYSGTFVPHLESGYPDKIPLSLISEVWFIKIIGRVPSPEIKFDRPKAIHNRKELFFRKIRLMDNSKD